ncbi:MAG: hypothetical protein WAX66_03675 [Patescibacteria group bacterium]
MDLFLSFLNSLKNATLDFIHNYWIIFPFIFIIVAVGMNWGEKLQKRDRENAIADVKFQEELKKQFCRGIEAIDNNDPNELDETLLEIRTIENKHRYCYSENEHY